jgi:hypothetical protein
VWALKRDKGQKIMKNENKHTPGPWEMTEVETAEYAITASSKMVNYGGGEEPVIIMHTPQIQLPGDTEENFANAALIAAAPDLLAALETLINVRDVNNYKAYEAARAAIVKAKKDIIAETWARKINGNQKTLERRD